MFFSWQIRRLGWFLGPTLCIQKPHFGIFGDEEKSQQKCIKKPKQKIVVTFFFKQFPRTKMMRMMTTRMSRIWSRKLKKWLPGFVRETFHMSNQSNLSLVIRHDDEETKGVATTLKEWLGANSTETLTWSVTEFHFERVVGIELDRIRGSCLRLTKAECLLWRAPNATNRQGLWQQGQRYATSCVLNWKIRNNCDAVQIFRIFRWLFGRFVSTLLLKWRAESLKAVLKHVVCFLMVWWMNTLQILFLELFWIWTNQSYDFGAKLQLYRGFVFV